MTDQYTFRNPVTAYDQIEPPEQSQPEPGMDAKMTPKADLGEETYRGTGRLEGRKALITGADSGIGAATAIAFAREGADVVMSYLPEEEEDAARIANLIEKAGRKAVKVPGDLKDSAVCRELVETAVRELGGLTSWSTTPASRWRRRPWATSPTSSSTTRTRPTCTRCSG